MRETNASAVGRLHDLDDQQSWAEFYHDFGPLLHELGMKLGLTSAEAEDAAQDTVILIARKISEFQYDRKKGRFRDWVYVLARHQIAEHWRKRKMKVETDPVGNEEGGTSSIEEIADPASDPMVEDLIARHEAIFKLSCEHVKTRVAQKTWQIFDCYVLKGWPAEKVAVEFGINEARVYSTKYEITNLIKKDIKANAMRELQIWKGKAITRPRPPV